METCLVFIGAIGVFIGTICIVHRIIPKLECPECICHGKRKP